MRILFVDDSVFVQKMMHKLLTAAIPECEVIIAEDGEKGFERYLEMTPDLVITDLLMPNVDGQELIRKIRATGSDTRIIVISADVQKATRDEIEAMGIEGFLNKPMTAEKSQTLIQLIMGA